MPIQKEQRQVRGHSDLKLCSFVFISPALVWLLNQLTFLLAKYSSSGPVTTQPLALTSG